MDYKLGWRVAFAFVSGLYLTAALAVDNKMEQRDESMQVYKRQAVMILPEIGLARKKVPVEVDVCYTKCRTEKRKWVFPITPQLRERLSQRVMTLLSQKRFDLVKLEKGQLKIITKTTQKAIPAKKLPAFHTDVLPMEQWQQQVEQYLNKYLAPFVQPLQKTALEQRYWELPEQEQATFIRTQAKSLGLPLDVVPMLLDSQFVMALYQPPVEGDLTITRVKREGKPSYYSNSFAFDISNKLFIYRYQSATNSFKLFKVLTGASGRVSESQNTARRPYRPKHIYGLFEAALEEAERASTIQLLHELKDIPEFQMASIVQSVDWWKLKAGLSEQDDLRIDALYRVQRSINGTMETVGFAKARRVAKAEEAGVSPSEFKLVKGDAEPGDRLVETTWMGSNWGVDLLSQGYKFKKIEGQAVAQPDQNINWLRWQARFDQGYFRNEPKYIESWVSLYVALGAGDGDLKTGQPQLQWKSPIAFKLGMDFVNHNTLTRGWSAGYGFGLEANFMSFDAAQKNGDSLSYFSLDGVGKLQLTYLISDKSQLGFYVDYPLSLVNQANVKETEVKADFTPGLTVGIGYQHAFSSLGFLHSWYKD